MHVQNIIHFVTTGIGSNADCWFWLGHGAYFSEEHYECFFVLGDTFQLWNRSEVWNAVSPAKVIWDLDPFGPTIVKKIAQFFNPMGGGPVLGPVNMYTYRTKDFLLSSAQDYHGEELASYSHFLNLFHQYY